MLDWLAHIGIRRTDRIVPINLRGRRLPLTRAAEEVTRWLKIAEIEVWMLDPWARVINGSGSENSTDDTTAVTEIIDEIKRLAGVKETLITAHTGRVVVEDGEERSRGAQRLEDWADALLFYTKDGEDYRYLRAEGRDVDLDQSRLSYNPELRRLTFIGGSRVDHHAELAGRAAYSVLQAAADRGEDISTWSQDTLIKAIGGREAAAAAGISYAYQHGWLIQERRGGRGGGYTYKIGSAPHDG